MTLTLTSFIRSTTHLLTAPETRTLTKWGPVAQRSRMLLKMARVHLRLKHWPLLPSCDGTLWRHTQPGGVRARERAWVRLQRRRRSLQRRGVCKGWVPSTLSRTACFSLLGRIHLVERAARRKRWVQSTFSRNAIARAISTTSTSHSVRLNVVDSPISSSHSHTRRHRATNSAMKGWLRCRYCVWYSPWFSG